MFGRRLKKILPLFLFSIYVNAQNCLIGLSAYCINGPSITCANPAISVQAVHCSSNALNFAWTGPGFSSNSNSVLVTQPGSYTVVATDPLSLCTATSLFNIYSNTTVPVSSLSPLTATVICNNAASLTGSALSPTNHILHKWYTPVSPWPSGPGSNTTNALSSIFSASAGPGVYTHELKDMSNGCVTIESATLTSTDAYPAFGLFSPNNFALGCGAFNQTTISLVNPVSTQSPPANCSYTFLAPSFTGIVGPGILGGNTGTVSNLPGNWTVMVQDDGNGCRTSLEVPVQNPAVPDVAAAMYSYTLFCRMPVLNAYGFSGTEGANISWLVPSTPSLIMSPTIVVGPPTGPLTSSANLVYANYTVVATNTLNGCSSTSVLSIYQNFRAQPVFATVSLGTPTTLCNGPVVIVATCTNCWWPPEPPIWAIPNWSGPPPQVPAMGQSSYSCYVPGIYTLNAQDNYTGCYKTSTINIVDSRPQFYLGGSPPTNSANCDGNVFINPLPPYGATVAVSAGTLNGTSVTNLCNGWVKVCLTYPSSGCVKCDSILMDEFVGNTVNEGANKIVIYPNPAHQKLFLKM